MSRRLFISGATGFVGGRLAEIACSQGNAVAALVRTWSRAARLARLPVRLTGGDLLDLDAVRTAMSGADVAFHCAVDNRADGDAHIGRGVTAVENVLRAASDCNVNRVVHLSSVAVYGYRPRADASTEDGAFADTDDPYCRGKIEAEQAATRMSAELGVPLVILRPTIVYGPFGGWTVDTVDRLRRGRQAIIDDGSGACNALYVDNLIDAMLRAADRDEAVGQTLHVSDAAPISWRRFVEAHAAAIGIDPAGVPRCDRATARAANRAADRERAPMTSLRRTTELLHDAQFRWALTSIPVVDRSVRLTKRVAVAVLPGPVRTRVRRTLVGDESPSAGTTAPIPTAAELDIYTTDVVFSIERARRILGYEPRIDFETGMHRTHAWIQWAQLNN